MTNTKKNKTTEEKEADRILDRIEHESETIGSSSLARSAQKTRNHFLGKDADPDDPIEKWGTRIGRGLSVIIVVALITYLYNTFFAGRQ